MPCISLRSLIAAVAAEVSFSMATQARIGAIFFHSPPLYRFFLKKAPPFLAKRVGKSKKILKILLVMSDAFAGLRAVRVSKFSVAVKV